MVIDSSALVAILLDEPDAEALAGAIARDPRRMVSAFSLLEASVVLDNRKGAEAVAELEMLLADLDVAVVELTAAQSRTAREAYRRFGKGRHPAGLNLGDCCAYALALTLGEPLLFKGDDFPHTDVPASPVMR
jgi:ribonuclease VapC